MSLTKEECLRAVRVLACRNESGEGIEALYPYFKLEIDCLLELIHEQFDNPPLKWEELEPDMWVWDNVDKEFIKIIETRIADEYDDYFVEGIKAVRLFNHISYWCDYAFEKNRFYRKQVEE